MRRIAAVLTVVVTLAVPIRARGEGETGKARAMVIAGSIMTAMGVTSMAAGFGIMGDCMNSPYGCQDTGLLFIPLLTVGAGHFLIGLPLLIVGVQRFNALPRQHAPPAAASPLFY